MRVRRVKKFIEEYNREIDRKLGLIQDNKGTVPIGSLPHQMEDSENKLYMGGIPPSMTSEEVRRICAGFGTLKSFNLVTDPANKGMNRGFAFLEFTTDKDTEKAIKALDGFEIMDKKLKIQRASIGAKAPVVNKVQQPSLGFQTYVNPKERIRIPLFAMTPSRVVQFLNIVTPEDLLDETEKKEILKELCAECKEFGDVVDIQAPGPDVNTGNCTKGVGKVFVKFNHIVAAKQARFNLSGRRYRGKLVIGSFYPENYFDTNEFDISVE